MFSHLGPRKVQHNRFEEQTGWYGIDFEPPAVRGTYFNAKIMMNPFF